MSTCSPPSVIPQHYEIVVDDRSAEPIVDLFQIDFFNEGECVTFNCSIACTNDYKVFWMGQGNHNYIYAKNIIKTET